MSRIGKMPIAVPDKVKVAIEGKTIKVEGPKGKSQLTLAAQNPCKVAVDGKALKVERPDDSRQAKAMHGITRTLVANMVRGVSTGFERALEITGVGFRAEVKGKEVHFTLGFSHPVVFPLPEGVTAEVEKQTRVIIRGADKHALGLTAAKIRALRPPEPYKGKGIKYAEETIRRKQGKTGAA